jgi:hypothetical protein
VRGFWCTVHRTSGGDELPCGGALPRFFSNDAGTGRFGAWGLRFESPAAFFEWLRELGERVVVSRPWYTKPVDGEPAPEWDVEIYDDYRE